MQVMDFTALGAQAVAQVERAQRAAREQLIAAMNQRPKLSLKLELEGPKIAIPVPEADPQGGSFHWRPVLPCSCSIPPGSVQQAFNGIRLLSRGSQQHVRA